MRAVAASVRDSTGPMRAMSARLLEEEQKKKEAGPEVEKAADWAAANAAHLDGNPLVGLGWGSGWGSREGRGRGGDTAGVEGGDVEGEQVGDGSAGYVEFLPVEWFEEVRGDRFFLLLCSFAIYGVLPSLCLFFAWVCLACQHGWNAARNAGLPPFWLPF